MGRNKKTHFLFLLLHLLQICRGEDCPEHPDKNLTCYNDFDRSITCVWSGSSASDHKDVCTLHVKESDDFGYSASCTLQPFGPSSSALQTCSLFFDDTYVFLSIDVFPITLSCLPSNLRKHITYKPSCHIKLNPPEKPDVNLTTVSWITNVENHMRINSFGSQLEWKHQDQSWSDAAVQKKEINCKENCKAQLDPDLLVQGETYEARVRLKELEFQKTWSDWSDWSPTESWVSHVGKIKPPPGTPVDVMNMSLVGLAVFGSLLVVVFIRMNKTTWVYMVKKVANPPIPNPAKSVHFQNWLSPNFTSESFHSFLKPVEIVSVEVTSTLDAVTSYEPDVKVMPENDSYESSLSSFSNPSYSHLCSPSTTSSVTAGELQPCSTDAPYGPVRCQAEEVNPEQCRDEAAEKQMEIMKLLLSGSEDRESVKVILDYEKVKELPIERFRLHSIDSGMCSYEEASQESVEVDSINMTDGHDEGNLSKDEKKGGDRMMVDVLKLFGSSGGVLGKSSIQVCLDYKAIPRLQAGSPELPSLDSGVSCRDESQEDKDKPTHFLFPPYPPSDFNCSSPFLPPLPSIHEEIPLMSGSMTVQPCGDGYKSVRQE